jgi:prevent-host-death family protein
MTHQYSIAEFRGKLSKLVKRAEKGEDIVITRHGKPVVKLGGFATKPAPKRITKEAIAWLDKHRVKGKVPKEDAGTYVSRMRDEEWPR